MNKIRVAAVSYLNTKPLLYGLQHHPIGSEIELLQDYPAKIAQLLMDDEVDIGLIPVAAVTKLPLWQLVGDYCIGCDGPVASVCLFSEVPLEKIETVLLDYQSRTSVSLAKILLKEYWQKNVVFVNAATEDYRQQIRGTTAGVVIGDRALEQRQHSKYIYDLGGAWKEFTGLPFVFAAWISNKKLSVDFLDRFNKANALGLAHIDVIVAENTSPFYDLRTYYTSNISYQLDEQKQNGMALFLQHLRSFSL